MPQVRQMGLAAHRLVAGRSRLAVAVPALVVLPGTPAAATSTFGRDHVCPLVLAAMDESFGLDRSRDC